MQNMPLQYPCPQNPEDFVSLCLRLFREHWSCDNLEKYARRGQRQSGIDLIGNDREGRICAIQCKHREFGRVLTKTEILNEINPAKTYKPKISRYAIATSAKRNRALQDFAIAKTEEHKKKRLFSVEICSWDDIVELLNQHPEIAEGGYSPPPGAGATASPGQSTIRAGRDVNITIQYQETLQSAAQLGAQKGEPRDLHREIDRAGRHITAGRYETAVALLREVRRRDSSRLTSRCRYRIAANLGHIFRLMGKTNKAASHYLKAKEYEPDNKDARFFEILAHSMRGNTRKARTLAVRLASDLPNFKRAKVTLLGTAPLSVEFETLEASVPKNQRANAEVALALARGACQRRRWQVGETYARKAVKNEPKWAEPKIALAEIIYSLEFPRFFNMEIPAVEPNRPRLQESINLTAAAIKLLSNREGSVEEIARLRALMFSLHSSLGEAVAADTHIRLAYEASPTNAQVAVGYAASRLNAGDESAAITVLRKILKTKHPLQVDLLLADALCRRNRDNDMVEAAELLRRKVKRLKDEESSFRSQFCCTLLTCYVLLRDAPRIHDFLRRPEVKFLTPAEASYYRAEAEFIEGHQHEADTFAAESLRLSTGSTDPVLITRLARLLERLKKWDKTLELWRRIASTTRPSPAGRHLVICATRVGRNDLVVELCQHLREAHVYDEEFIRAELWALRDSISLTIGLLQELLAVPLRESFRRELRVTLSAAALQDGRRELVDTDPSHLPLVGELPDVRVGVQVVEVMRLGPSPLNAVIYAYNLYRRYPGDYYACKAVITSFNMDIASRPDIKTPTTIEAGVAVKYREDDSGREDWVILEDTDEPNPLLDEYKAEESSFKDMLGKSVNDSFVMRSKPLRTATVLDIINKYVYRFRKCMEDAELRYHDKALLYSIHIPQLPTGEPDVKPILDQIKEMGIRVNNVIRCYLEGPVTLYMVGNVRRMSVFDAMCALADDSSAFIKCHKGAIEDMRQTVNALERSNGVVMDTSAMSTLYCLHTMGHIDIRALLKSVPCELVASELDIVQFRALLSRLKLEAGRHSAAGSYRHGRFTMTEVTEEQRDSHIHALETLIQSIGATCRVESSIVARTPSGIDATLANEYLGRASTHCMTLAQEQGHAIWSDDWVIGDLARGPLHITRAWTQSVLTWLSLSRKLPEETETKCVLTLARAGYAHTFLHHNQITVAASECRWDFGDPLFSRLLGGLRITWSDPRARTALAVECLEAVCRSDKSDPAMTIMATKILDTLKTVPDGRAIITFILDNAERLFGSGTSSWVRTVSIIEAWLKATPAIILPR